MNNGCAETRDLQINDRTTDGPAGGKYGLNLLKYKYSWAQKIAVGSMILSKKQL